MRPHHTTLTILCLVLLLAGQSNCGVWAQRVKQLERDTTTRVRKTVPETIQDLDSVAVDLRDPDNLKVEAEYDPETGQYLVGTRMKEATLEGQVKAPGKGGKSSRSSSSSSGSNASNGSTSSLNLYRSFLTTPILMTSKEYNDWGLSHSLHQYYRQKNREAYESSGKDKFDFSDMHFSLGPAEKIFGPGGVTVKTTGSAEIKVGANHKKIENPSLAANRRSTFGFDFDEKINLSVKGTVGDKVNLNFNYNTEASFRADAQNMKLKYDGKEDEIIKLVEAGNVSLSSTSNLVRGATSLFGLHTTVQFGKLKLEAVVSQKKSASASASSKGGSQTTSYELEVTDYEENRHFWLAHFFRDNYDQWMRTLPTIASGVTIKRIELWVTNKTASTQNNRNLIAFTDLGESKADDLQQQRWYNGSASQPQNRHNSLYGEIVANHPDARDISKVTSDLDASGLVGAVDYEKVQSARLLSSTEYTVNSALGYVSLNFQLEPDEVLAAAYEYTAGGVTYQVGEFAQDLTDNTQCLFVKTLKSTSNTPTIKNWDLMMRNIYALGASTVQKEKFRMDVKYQSDSSGVYITYLPEEQLKSTVLLKALNLDRIDASGKSNPDGQFDFVEGYTVTKGRIIFPVAEPFGDALRSWIMQKTSDPTTAQKYCFDELYDTTKTVARQTAEKNKFMLTGQYKGSNAAEIDLGTTNVAVGSVVVTAGGVTLTENVDYRVNYSSGIVEIINQSIIDAGTKVSASVESNNDFGMQRKTMLGLNWDYEASKNFTFGGTFQYLNEQPLTTKVAMGSEPLKNFLWGVHLDWKKESQWLTNVINAIPFLNFTAPSQISFSGEFAQLVAGQSKSVQGQASYLDDFEQTKIRMSISTPTSWMLSSVPTGFAGSKLTNNVESGFQRALLAWYYIDPIFTRRSSTLTPAHIKGNTELLSNHYVREVYERELFPNKSQNSYSEANALSVLNLAYYPTERGAYNLNPNLTHDGHLTTSTTNWGGMMRKTDNPDFEAQNIEYIEFWMLDPFIYTGSDPRYGGELYIDLGEVSEDVLKDGKKFYESGLPIDGNPAYYTETVWGRIPTTTSVTYAFNNDGGARTRQDVGLNGLSSDEEREFEAYKNYLTQIKGVVSDSLYTNVFAKDPAGDDYHYYRGSDYDDQKVGILERYKHINLPEANSPDTDNSPESYETAYKTTPDVEDINQDYTLNEYEKFFRFHVSIHPGDTIVGQNFITDIRRASVKLRNDNTENVRWFQYRIPIKDPAVREAIGGISDLTSIRFIRMFMTGCQEPLVLRFATLDLVEADWRNYEQTLYAGKAPSVTASVEVGAVNIEENNHKEPVNYVLPPGISRITDPSQTQLVEANEQALSIIVKNLSPGDARAVYKNCRYDMRQYKHLQLFVHANALKNDITELQDGETSVFLRLGSDYKNNYYEYEIPLTLTPEGHYDTYSSAGCRAVWPEENMFDIDLDIFTQLKKARNLAISEHRQTQSQSYTDYDPNRQNNSITIVGNPSLGEVKTIMIGVRNKGRAVKSVEVWANEMRLQEFSNEGGWAAQGQLNIQLSDLGSINAQGQIERAGFGGLEQSVSQRSNDNTYQYSITTQVDLGKLLPPTAKLSMPLYYSYDNEVVKPKYNPLDTDMLLSDALDGVATQAEKDSIESLTTTRATNQSFSLSGVKLNIQTNKKHPMPYDPANFTFNYSHTSTRHEGETTVYENEQAWKGGINYSWSPNWKAWEPFKKMKSKSKWLQLIKDFNWSFAPQSITLSTDIARTYYEIQERDMDNLTNPVAIPVRWTPTFYWNRDFNLRWDFTKNLHFSFQSGTDAEVEEPYVPVNKDLYPDEYSAWKDSVWQSVKGWGSPLAYQQAVQASYKVPFEKLPLTDWISADGTYQGNYTWKRGAELEDGSTLGNTVTTQRSLNLNGKLNMETLYNHSTFLKDANQRFSTSTVKSEGKKKDQEKKRAADAKKKEEAAQAKALAEAQKKAAEGDSTALKALQDPTKQTNAKGTSQKKTTFKGYAGEVTLLPDSAIQVSHGQKSKHIQVTAKTEDGKPYKIRFKRIDENNIQILPPKELSRREEPQKKDEEERKKKKKGKEWESIPDIPDTVLALVDSIGVQGVLAMTGNLWRSEADSTATTQQPATAAAQADTLNTLKLRVNVLALPDPKEQKWYQWCQAGARFLMMVRNVSVSYRNTYALNLPGFMPNVGDALGQRKGSEGLAPGVDFALGFVGDDYIERASQRGWLLGSESDVATPATSSANTDLQLKATLEPFPDFKIDVNASHTSNNSKSIQYMYAGTPTTQTGSLNMTTISIGTAFASKGNASNGYSSEVFNRFQQYLDVIQGRVENRYLHTTYPAATGMTGEFNPANGTVNKYSADVMVPAFLAAYTGGNAATTPLEVFPSLLRMLPNWSISYKGLSNLPWVRQHFKSIVLTHGYKSVFSIGSYNTFSSWVQYMGGSDMGYTLNQATNTYIPSSMYDISTVSINESFSPLIGMNVTLQNNMTLKLEYRKTRVLTLSMTSAQINEASSADIVVGWGYKINDFKLSSLTHKKRKTENGGNKKNGADEADNKTKSRTTTSKSSKSTFAHDLNLRFDFSYRNQDAITRDIQTSLSEATSGNNAIKASFQLDYTMSRYVTFSLYYDLQRNQPLLSSSSYPTLTQDFGFNLKFALTR